MVATIMLSGTLMLTFVPLVSNPATYLHFYIFAATWWVQHYSLSLIVMPYDPALYLWASEAHSRQVYAACHALS